MSEKELQSLMQRARRSLRSTRNLLDDGDHDFAMSGLTTRCFMPRLRRCFR